jgi:serine/threonine-protein kinase
MSAGQVGKKVRYEAEESSGPRLDIILMVLGIVAIIAILGLVPLFIALYAVYQGSYIPNQGSSLQVQVPDVVGLDNAVAQANLQNVGLNMTINGQAPHPSWPPKTVIEQSLPPGEVVRRGETVKVILSQGPAIIKVPNLVGMSADKAAETLASLALVPQKYEDWSVETPGLVIRQDPPAETEVEDHTLITLVVSSGSRMPIGANFGQQILLNAYEIPRNQYKVGENIKLTFFWNLVRQPTENYILYIHLTTQHGGIVSEIKQSTQDWQMGNVIVDSQELPIPTTATPGEYQIRVTFYNSQANRLAIADVGRGESDNVGGLILRSIQLVP